MLICKKFKVAQKRFIITINYTKMF